MTRMLEGGISIVDWGSSASAAPLVTEVRGLLEANDLSGILVDMRACDELLADHLEALTEANRVCRDRNCRIGLFGFYDRLARLVEVSGLRDEVPDLLNGDEQQVVAAFRNGKQVTTASPELEFEIDLGAPSAEAMTAPTARFDSATVSSSEPYSPVDMRDDRTQTYGTPPRQGEQQPDQELLAVFWADLTSTGYVIGGDHADQIMNAVTTGPRSQPTEPEEGVIDLGDAAPAKKEFKTQMLPAFDLGSSGSGEGWTATPSGAVEVDFGGPASGLAPEAAGVFGGGGDGDFSPLDDAGASPPAAVLQARAQQQPPTADLPEDGDETVMFQPGALDEALRQAGMAAAAAAAPAPAPIEEMETPPLGHTAVGEDGFPGEDSDETVMFQPGALDMALLAEVAAAAGPEQTVPAPPVETPPPEPRPQQAPAGGTPMPDGFEVEVRLFMHDFAINSNLHLQVLDRFVKAEEEVLGRTDLQVATGGTRGQVIEIVDQFVQSRLVRRMRSPRIRGGSGFMFCPSPATRNTVTRLLKMWQNPQERQKVAAWLRGN